MSVLDDKVYYLMNKDTPWAQFWFENEGTMLERVCSINEELTRNINSWLTGRNAAKHREHISKLLKELGCELKSDFCKLTKCLSLNDTLWVKVPGDNSSWKDISLYKNEFSNIISYAAFSGNGFGDSDAFSSTAPEWTTNGQFGKCWRREDGIIELVKCGTKDSDLPVYSEYLAASVFYALDKRSVQYRFELVDDRVATVCELFTNETVGYRPYVDFLNQGDPVDVGTLRDVYAKYGYDDLFSAMVIGDCVTYNVDRHFGNFGWYVLNDDMMRRTMSPVFDFNLCFFPFAASVDELINAPDVYSPRLGVDWVYTAKYLMTDKIRAELINMKDLWLDCPLSDQMTKDRLSIINKMKNDQIDRILGRKTI